MNIKGCFLHSSDDWKTPPEIYDYFIQQGYIDPCPFKAEFDGLKIIHKDKKVFINPPYSKLKYGLNMPLNYGKRAVKLCF